MKGVIIINQYIDKESLYKNVQEIREYLNITFNDYPLNIFDICENIKEVEIGVVPFKNQNLKGMVTIAQDENDNHVIIVNGNKTKEEQNYHGCHELLHIWFRSVEPGMSLNCFEKCKPNQNTFIEWLANEGAAELLVPFKVFLPLVKENKEEMLRNFGTTDFCEKYAVDFGVAPIVLKNRLNALKYEIYQYIEKEIDLDDIEILSKSKQDSLGIKIKSFNDLEDERLFSLNTIAI